MIPAPRANAGGVAEPALHFISKRDCSDQFASAGAHAFRHSKRRSNVVTRMRRLLRQISVVIIEIADATAIRERRPVWRRFVIRADDGRSVFRRTIRRNFSLDRALLFLPRSQPAA